MHVVLCARVKWKYSTEVEQMESALRGLKTKERGTGIASQIGMTFFPKCEVRRARSESEARERKANANAAQLAASGLSAPDVWTWTQPQRDAVAKRAGQRSPSEKTWALVLGKLERRKAA